jgi:hypothetical protein
MKKEPVILVLTKEKQMSSNTILQYFDPGHLPDGHLKYVSTKFLGMAQLMDACLPDGAEKSAGLRKLLEAKDCFVRAAIEKEAEEVEY